MNAHTVKPVVIEQKGKPAFAVIPWSDYLILTGQKEKPTTPHEVVSLMIEEDISPMKAWRKYLNMTQQQVAKKMGVSQANINKVENKKNKPKKSTRVNYANALGIAPSLLDVF